MIESSSAGGQRAFACAAFAFAFAASLGASACGGRDVDLGGEHTGAQTQGNGAVRDASRLPAGNNLAITIAVDTNGNAAGTATFGSGPALAPATDPTAAYPIGSNGSLAVIGSPYPGFAYTAERLIFDRTHLSFGLVLDELLASWCALPISYDWAPNSPRLCGCLPDWGGMGTGAAFTLSGPNGASVTVPDGLEKECNQFPYCSCNASGCGVDVTKPVAMFDLTLTTGHLDGTLTDGQSQGVHLALAP